MTLASIHTATPLLLDEEFVYWADSLEVEHRNTTFVMKVSKNGGQPIQVTSHPFYFNGFALNSTHLFWSDERGDIFMFPK